MIDAAVRRNCVRWSLKLSTVSESCNKERRLSLLAVGIDFELLYLKETEKIRLDLASLFIRLPGWLPTQSTTHHAFSISTCSLRARWLIDLACVKVGCDRDEHMS